MRKVNKQQAFQVLIEERMQAGLSYVDCMVEYMTEHQLEPKQVAKLLTELFDQAQLQDQLENLASYLLQVKMMVGMYRKDVFVVV